MNRIEDWSVEELNEQQLEIYNDILNGPRGCVVGPIKVWLNNPKFAQLGQKMGKYARYESSLSPILSELVIIITGRFWSAKFEWEQHAPLAIKHGLKKEYVEKIANGERPIFEDYKQQVVYDFVAEVNINKKVSDVTYKKAYNLLGKNSIIDIVAICGYYHLISITLNVFEIPAEDFNLNFPEIVNFNKMLP
tara:strand:+ start:540 stop:1115 length:576 start_codon:yes stop_codon:yes gene_type:complete